jgi:hypothetical protein
MLSIDAVALKNGQANKSGEGVARREVGSCDGNNGRGGWIRTNAWQDQNLLPYRLATPLYPVQESQLLASA